MPHHLHHVHHFAPPAPVPSDTWLNVVLGLAAVATALAFLGGLYVTVNYGRRATASITATAIPLAGGGFLMVIRPVVKAVGLFRIKFRKGTGAQITVIEMLLDTRYSGEPEENQNWTLNETYGSSRTIRVEPGEELGTSTALRLDAPSPRTIGWFVHLGVDGKRRWWVPWVPTFWSDRTYVSRPDTPPRSNTP